MAKQKKRPSVNTPAKKPASKEQDDRREYSMMHEPWLAMRSGLTVISLVSIGLFIYMTWQLYPTEGVGRAMLWGLGFAVGVWVIFGLSLGFNTWLRRRFRKGE